MTYSTSLLDAVVEIALLLATRLFFTVPANDRTEQAAANTTPAPHSSDPGDDASRAAETNEQFLSSVVEAANSMHDRR